MHDELFLKTRRRVLTGLALCAAAGATAAFTWPRRMHEAVIERVRPMLVAEVNSAANSAAEGDFQVKIKPFLSQYCYSCHGNGKETAGLALDSYQTLSAAMQDATTWELVQRYLHTHEMPPPAARQPTEGERDAVSNWVDNQLTGYFKQHVDPGRVTIHRLNRSEYDNSIRDLTGVDFHPAEDFPPDDSGYGFDNVGDALSLPPMLMEKYLTAADNVMGQAIVTDPIQSHVNHVPASLGEVGFNAFGDRGDGWVKLVSLEDDDCAVEMPILAAGDYRLRVMAYATADGGVVPFDAANPFQQRVGLAAYKKGVADDPPTLSLLLNDALIKTFVVTTDEKNPGVYEARIGVPAGKARFRAAMRRIRGGDNELNMKNGRLGKEQAGVIYVKYLEIEGPLHCATRRYLPGELEVSGKPKTTATGALLFTEAGAASVTIDAPSEGDFILRAQGYAMQAGAEPARMEFRVDDKPLQTFNVIAPGKMQALETQRIFSLTLLVPVPQVYEVQTHLTAGRHIFAAGFINPFADAKNANPNLRQRSLTLQNLEVVDPSRAVPAPPIPAVIASLIDKYAKSGANQMREAARSILHDFAFRAWRRPLRDGELDRVMALYDLADHEGDGFYAALKLGMKAVLISPHFLFRGEVQAQPDNPASVHPVDEFALASRLSYFIWSSTPDDELLDLASGNQLRKNLAGQVKRMLESPKSQAMVDNFGGQWLQFRSLETVSPDKTVYADYDASLRLAMQKETQLFFQYVLRADRSVMDFIDGDYSFVNDRLATLYGMAGITGDEFRKVSLAGGERRGVLTQASVLTLTSNPTRTSPVKRGKWVLENILGAPPPPPPPDVPSLNVDGKTITGTLRHQMELHRANAVCASCHARMDPIGFALENYDGIGEWRDTDGDARIDTSGKLLTGETITDPMQMIKVLATDRQDDYLRCLSEKMMTYALGRGIEVYDHAAVNEIVSELKAEDCRFSALVSAVAESVPFQMRRGEGASVGFGN